MATWKGSHNRILRGRSNDHHGFFSPLTSPGMILQGGGFATTDLFFSLLKVDWGTKMASKKNRTPEHSLCLTLFLGLEGLRRRWWWLVVGQTFQQHHVRMEGQICMEQPWNDAQIFVAAWEMSWQCSQGEACHLIAGWAPLPPAWVGACACKALGNPIGLHASSHDRFAPALRHPCVYTVESCFWRALGENRRLCCLTGWAIQQVLPATVLGGSRFISAKW